MNQILYTLTMRGSRKLEIQKPTTQNGGGGVKNENYKPLNVPDQNFLHLLSARVEVLEMQKLNQILYT